MNGSGDLRKFTPPGLETPGLCVGPVQRFAPLSLLTGLRRDGRRAPDFPPAVSIWRTKISMSGIVFDLCGAGGRVWQ